jgi:hypothetical protein
MELKKRDAPAPTVPILRKFLRADQCSVISPL